MKRKGRQKGYISHRRINYIKGEKIGNLIYVNDSTAKSIKRKAIFICSCGKEFEATIEHVKTFKTVSCGCGVMERAKNMITHGHCIGKKTTEYNIWRKMKDRCNNPNNPAYYNYGGRGIKICERWMHFDNFYADMGKRPSSLHSLDRFPNKNGNYELSNCRWATNKEQSNNTRRNKLLTYNVITKTIKEWAEIIGISEFTLYHRFNKGWSHERIITEPLNNTGKKSLK